MIYFESPRIGNGNELPTIISAIEALQETVTDDDGNTRQNVQGYSIKLKANVNATNKAIVQVNADVDVLRELAKSFSIAGHPTRTNEDGGPHVDKLKYDAFVAQEDSTERKDKHRVQKALDGINKTISDNARRDIQAMTQMAKLDADIVDYQSLLVAVQAFEIGEYAGDEIDIYDGLSELFPRQAPEWVAALDFNKVDTSTYNDIYRHLDALIAQTAKQADQLDADIAQRLDDLSGDKDEGQNLTQRKAELETKLGAYSK